MKHYSLLIICVASFLTAAFLDITFPSDVDTWFDGLAFVSFFGIIFAFFYGMVQQNRENESKYNNDEEEEDD
jgi:mannose/fructose/N-acetylgalactosamine-specific phosphotransferase system component IIC